MTKLSKKELEEIIKRDAKGYRIATPAEGEDAVASRVRPEEGTPDIADLRRKYGDTTSRDHASGNPGASEGEDSVSDNPGHGRKRSGRKDTAIDEAPEDVMVALEPDAAPNPWDHGAKPKVVVVSGKDKRIISSQG